MKLNLASSSVALLMCGYSATAQITVDPLSSTTLCANATTDVTFQATGVFDPGNTFTVELSDASGSFAVPVAIGSISATTSSTVSCTVPVQSGTGFRIRVSSSSPIARRGSGR